MRDLRTIRIFLATIFLVASLAYLFIGPEVNPMAVISFRSQIIPSALAVTIGATAFWLVATFLFGRLYCSTVCPVGTLHDIAIRARRLRPSMRPFAYRPAERGRWVMLGAYIVCLILGVTAFAWIAEPWTLLQSTAGLVRPSAVESTWAAKYSWSVLGGGATVGCAVSAVILAVYIVWAFFDGRRFCTEVCPIGIGLGAVAERALFHIEIDPDKCIDCMKCEEICPSHCVKVVGRYVDDSRCVRCFDCLKVCPNDAIRYQRNRNRRATPLMRRRTIPKV